MLDKYEEKEKSRLSRWLGNLRALLIVVTVLLGFAVVAVLYIPQLQQPFSTIAYVVGILAVGSLIRSLAK
jgi:quinol-cytochrome oxidoreductase complex cytochrome b subunit